MSKKHKHPEHVNLERWLVSYADFITLLFAFFVVLFASSQVDRSKSKKMSLAIEAAFNRFAIFKYQSGDTDNAEEQGTGPGGTAMRYRNQFVLAEDAEKLVVQPQNIGEEEFRESINPPQASNEAESAGSGFYATDAEALAHARRDIMRLLEKLKITSGVKFLVDDRGIVISIQEAGIFETGADQLTAKTEEFLKGIGIILSKIPNQVRIEGHTDNSTPSDRFDSNWDLSSARANFILKWLLSHYTLKPSRFMAIGYGEYRPVGDNNTEEGRKQNRRVDLVILSDNASKKEAPIARKPGIPTAQLPVLQENQDQFPDFGKPAEPKSSAQLEELQKSLNQLNDSNSNFDPDFPTRKGPLEN